MRCKSTSCGAIVLVKSYVVDKLLAARLAHSSRNEAHRHPLGRASLDVALAEV